MTSAERGAAALALAAAVLLVLAAAPRTAPAAVADARFLFVHGPVFVVNKAGHQRGARPGGHLTSGETIHTGRGGRAQIRFSDGGLMALSPDTVFGIDNYHYDQGKPQSDNAFFRLLKGGLRAITGLVGRHKRERWRIVSPIASIGIRGTELNTHYDPTREVQDLSMWRDPSDPDSVIVFCGIGAACTDVFAGEYAEYQKGEPKPIKQVTGIVVEPPASPSAELVVGDERNGSGQAIIGSLLTAPPGTAAFYAFNYAGSVHSFADHVIADGSIITTTSGGAVVQFAQIGPGYPCEGPPCVFDANGATLTYFLSRPDLGATITSWQNFSFSDQTGSKTPLDEFHVVKFDSLQSMSAGWPSYSAYYYGSGTGIGRVTHAPSGQVGTVQWEVDVNFGAVSGGSVPISYSYLDFNFPGGSASFSGSGSIGSSGAGSIGFSGGCSGSTICPGGKSATGSAQIGLGPGAKSIGGAFHATTNDGTEAFSGAAVIEQSLE